MDLPRRLENTFSEIDSDIVIDLRKTNEKYAELQRQISEIKQRNPFIDKVMEGSGDISLTADEHRIFVDCLRLCRRLDDMERQQLYFRGHTDAIAYLKEVKLI